mmetsp:Transcript_19529/g.41081  ORF Transcript_19529/g.41081 Transcript_19529/m.41081 type:complete len:81 (+) Transcript_19529:671-913(+)
MMKMMMMMMVHDTSSTSGAACQRRVFPATSNTATSIETSQAAKRIMTVDDNPSRVRSFSSVGEVDTQTKLNRFVGTHAGW